MALTPASALSALLRASSFFTGGAPAAAPPPPWLLPWPLPPWPLAGGGAAPGSAGGGASSSKLFTRACCCSEEPEAEPCDSTLFPLSARLDSSSDSSTASCCCGRAAGGAGATLAAAADAMSPIKVFRVWRCQAGVRGPAGAGGRAGVGEGIGVQGFPGRWGPLGRLADGRTPLEGLPGPNTRRAGRGAGGRRQRQGPARGRERQGLPARPQCAAPHLPRRPGNAAGKRTTARCGRRSQGLLRQGRGAPGGRQHMLETLSAGGGGAGRACAAVGRGGLALGGSTGALVCAGHANRRCTRCQHAALRLREGARCKGHTCLSWHSTPAISAPDVLHRVLTAEGMAGKIGAAGHGCRTHRRREGAVAAGRRQEHAPLLPRLPLPCWPTAHRVHPLPHLSKPVAGEQGSVACRRHGGHRRPALAASAAGTRQAGRTAVQALLTRQQSG